MTLGEKIQTCRKSNGLSQEEMASVLGVSRQALSKWECNTSIPDIDKIVVSYSDHSFIRYIVKIIK
jgi:transcriptional regulator with XRE-family HTH domain